MGKTEEERVESKPSVGGSVKVTDLQRMYEQGKSPQEVADHFDVEVTDVVASLGLNVDAKPTETFANDPAAEPRPEPAKK